MSDSRATGEALSILAIMHEYATAPAELRTPLREEMSRRVREIIAERDAAVARLDALTLPDAARRERIATTCLAGMPVRYHLGHHALPDVTNEWSDGQYAEAAILRADALIAALDAPKETP